MGPKHTQAMIQLQQIPELNELGLLSVQVTDKGLINYNFNVKTLSGVVHARINQPDVLGIDRNHEAIVLERIKHLKIAPTTITNNFRENYLITEFIDLPTWTKQDCYKHQELLINHLKKIHSIDLSHKLPSFLSRLKQYEDHSLHGFDASFKVDYLTTKLTLIELGVFEKHQLLHFDLNASNLIGAKKLTIIDWEFAGCGHPIFDLAIFIHYNKLEILRCEKAVDYCNTFENGAEILRHSIKLAGYMIKLWEGKGA